MQILTKARREEGRKLESKLNADQAREVTYHLAFHMPCTTFVCGFLGGEFNVGQLDYYLQSSLGVVLFYIHNVHRLIAKVRKSLQA
jgi:hypothetical protein